MIHKTIALILALFLLNPLCYASQIKLLGEASDYVIKKGDTLSLIAKHHKITTNCLAKYNRIKNSNKIYIGQSLYIPNQAQCTK